jgi:hypothetical protein
VVGVVVVVVTLEAGRESRPGLTLGLRFWLRLKAAADMTDHSIPTLVSAKLSISPPFHYSYYSYYHVSMYI